MIEIGPARPEHRKAIVSLWHRGWHDAHESIVPVEIFAVRTYSHFQTWFDTVVQPFDVACRNGQIVGFVATRDAELERLYVDEAARGSDVARALLDRAETKILRSGFRTAHLYCTAGNGRAQRFYEREGWSLVQTGSGSLWMPDDWSEPVYVETHRYEKVIE